MTNTPTVTVQRAWLERLLELADELRDKQVSGDPLCAHLLGYIESARSLISDVKETQ